MKSPNRIAFALCSLLASVPLWAQEPVVNPGPQDLQADALMKIERKLGKEPAYQQTPKYGLLLFGAEAKFRVWLVIDGNTLFVFCSDHHASEVGTARKSPVSRGHQETCGPDCGGVAGAGELSAALNNPKSSPGEGAGHRVVPPGLG